MSSVASSSRYTFTPEAHTRAVPLSSALLKQNPALDAALRQFESQRQKFHEAFIIPRLPKHPARPQYAEEDYLSFAEEELSEDGYDEDDEDDWSDDGDDSEAEDKWETRDGMLVLPSAPAPLDLLPHPRADFSSSSYDDNDSIFDVDSSPSSPSMPSLSRFSTDESEEETLAEPEEQELNQSWERAMSFAGWRKAEEKDSWENAQASPVLQRLVAMAQA